MAQARPAPKATTHRRAEQSRAEHAPPSPLQIPRVPRRVASVPSSAPHTLCQRHTPCARHTVALPSSVGVVASGLRVTQVVDALTAMGFGQEDVQWVFSLCASVLHLGNVRFIAADGGEGSTVDGRSAHAVQCAALYLGVESAALSAALTERQIAIRGEVRG